MRHLMQMMTLSCACLMAPPTMAQSWSTIDTIVIDPGHGGEDLGAAGPEETLEKDLALQISLQLQAAIEEALPGVRVILTRTVDTYPTLEQRTHLANSVEADLFISLHLNSAPNVLAEGIETFYLAPVGTAPGQIIPGQEVLGPAEPQSDIGVHAELPWLIAEDLRRVGAMRDSAEFADALQVSLLASTDAMDRGVRTGQFRVLRGARMPAVVVELGFLTHEEEGARLLTADYQAQLVQGLMDGIAAYDAQCIQVASQWELQAHRIAAAESW
jgi:N-acetylmuramoyl-L-alanine amidase